MCNFIKKKAENKFRKISNEGIGWKLFTLRQGDYIPLCNYEQRYPINTSIKWNNKKYPDSGDGFCFFRKVPKWWEDKKIPYWLTVNTKMVKIRYKKGLGSFTETDDYSWPKGTRFAICKEFMILSDSKIVEELENEKTSI